MIISHHWRPSAPSQRAFCLRFPLHTAKRLRRIVGRMRQIPLVDEVKRRTLLAEPLETVDVPMFGVGCNV